MSRLPATLEGDVLDLTSFMPAGAPRLFDGFDDIVAQEGDTLPLPMTHDSLPRWVVFVWLGTMLFAGLVAVYSLSTLWQARRHTSDVGVVTPVAPATATMARRRPEATATAADTATVTTEDAPDTGPVSTTFGPLVTTPEPAPAHPDQLCARAGLILLKATPADTPITINGQVAHSAADVAVACAHHPHDASDIVFTAH